MRPVNLIPEDQRRAARGPGSRGTLITYGFLGVLAAAVLIVSALVLTSNQINDRKEKIAELEGEAASAGKAAKALEAYGNFARLEEARVATVKGLAESRFNWERILRALSRTIPSDVWLTSFKGTVSPDIEIESEGSGSGTGTLREKSTSPAIEVVGCTYSHKSVARMMVHMRAIDGVSEVVLSKSERPESQTSSTSAQPVEGESAGASGGDCRTNPEITKFELLVVLANADSPATAPTEGGAAPTPAAQTGQPAPPAGASAPGQSTPAPTGAPQ